MLKFEPCPGSEFNPLNLADTELIERQLVKMLAMISLNSTPISTEKEKEELFQAADISFLETDTKLKNILETLMEVKTKFMGTQLTTL